jgi:hypothetical protein
MLVTTSVSDDRCFSRTQVTQSDSRIHMLPRIPTLMLSVLLPSSFLMTTAQAQDAEDYKGALAMAKREGALQPLFRIQI